MWAWYAGPDKTLGVLTDGRQEIKDFIAPRRANLAEQGVQMRHYQTNTVLTKFKGNMAKTRTIVLVTWQYATEVAPRLVHTGHYDNIFVRTKDGWKSKERVILVICAAFWHRNSYGA